MILISLTATHIDPSSILNTDCGLLDSDDKFVRSDIGGTSFSSVVPGSEYRCEIPYKSYP
jgi:hypothetical protein